MLETPTFPAVSTTLSRRSYDPFAICVVSQPVVSLEPPMPELKIDHEPALCGDSSNDQVATRAYEPAGGSDCEPASTTVPESTEPFSGPLKEAVGGVLSNDTT